MSSLLPRSGVLLVILWPAYASHEFPPPHPTEHEHRHRGKRRGAVRFLWCTCHFRLSCHVTERPLVRPCGRGGVALLSTSALFVSTEFRPGMSLCLSGQGFNLVLFVGIWFPMVVFVLARLWRFVKVLSECLFVVLLFLFLLTPKGGRGCQMLSSCLESQGCRLILLSYLQLFSFSFFPSPLALSVGDDSLSVASAACYLMALALTSMCLCKNYYFVCPFLFSCFSLIWNRSVWRNGRRFQHVQAL